MKGRLFVLSKKFSKFMYYEFIYFLLNKIAKRFPEKNIFAVYFSKLAYIHSHFPNTKHLHYLKSLKHGNIHIYNVNLSVHTEFQFPILCSVPEIISII